MRGPTTCKGGFIMISQSSGKLMLGPLSAGTRLILVTIMAIAMPIFGAATARAQDADRADVQALVEKFFAAYQKKDLAAIMALWSDESPQRDAAKETIERDFASSSAIGIKGLDVQRMAVEGSYADVQVTLKADKGVAGPAGMHPVLQLVKEKGAWKVWLYISNEEEGLINSLGSAESAEARNRMLENRKDLLSLRMTAALGAEGFRLLAQYNYERALVFFDLGETASRMIDDKEGMASSLYGSGGTRSILGRYAEARSCFQKCLEISTAIRDTQRAASALNGIGEAEYAEGNYTSALHSYQKALDTSGPAGNKQRIALSLNGLGNTYKALGANAASLDHYKRSLQVSEEIGDKRGMAATLVNLGSIYQLEGNYLQALRYYQRSQELWEETGRKRGL